MLSKTREVSINILVLEAVILIWLGVVEDLIEMCCEFSNHRGH
jgi:hypothetical protein